MTTPYCPSDITRLSDPNGLCFAAWVVVKLVGSGRVPVTESHASAVFVGPLCLFRHDPAQIFEQNEQVHGICGRGDEIKVFVKTPRLFVFRVHSQGAYSGYLGRLQRALHRVPPQ